MDTPLLHLDPDDPPLVVARLPDHAPLPFPGACRDVSLTHDVLTHVVQRRLKDGDAQVSLVLRRMREVLQAPTHWGRLTAARAGSSSTLASRGTIRPASSSA